MLVEILGQRDFPPGSRVFPFFLFLSPTLRLAVAHGGRVHRSLPTLNTEDPPGWLPMEIQWRPGPTSGFPVNPTGFPVSAHLPLRGERGLLLVNHVSLPAGLCPNHGPVLALGNQQTSPPSLGWQPHLLQQGMNPPCGGGESPPKFVYFLATLL